MAQQFTDRADAGRQLARELTPYTGRDDVLVLGLPRGGIPVAYEVARYLGAPLDVFLVRKLGVPGHEELAMGAIASGNLRVLNREVVEGLGIDQPTIDAVTQREQQELRRREQLYRGNRPPPPITGRVVILIDDGLATGSTMRAAAAAIRQQSPAQVIVAVPVGAPDTCAMLRNEVDEVVCLITPEPFRAIGLWYRNFKQTTDEEVQALLDRAQAASAMG